MEEEDEEEGGSGKKKRMKHIQGQQQWGLMVSLHMELRAHKLKP